MAARATLPLTLWLAVGLPAGAAEPTAEYEVRFEATWNEGSHPVDFPGQPHFSPLVGATHSPRVSFWQEGGLASRGIERMAELGATRPLANQVDNAIAAGDADQVLLGGGIARSPGSTRLAFTITAEHPLVTLVSMIAPSPDWFVGVHDLGLQENGEWVDRRVVDLVPWDAGTDDGTTYRSPDQDARTPQPISRITDGPLGTGEPYVGRFVFTRVDVEPPPPLLLSGGRLAVEVEWQRPDGLRGYGTGTAVTDDTGLFWFFSPSNVELMVKALDACATRFESFWLFAAGLTNVGVEIRVTDTATGETRTYSSPVGTPFQPLQDTRAFTGCP